MRERELDVVRDEDRVDAVEVLFFHIVFRRLWLSNGSGSGSGQLPYIDAESQAQTTKCKPGDAFADVAAQLSPPGRSAYFTARYT